MAPSQLNPIDLLQFSNLSHLKNYTSRLTGIGKFPYPHRLHFNFVFLSFFKILYIFLFFIFYYIEINIFLKNKNIMNLYKLFIKNVLIIIIFILKYKMKLLKIIFLNIIRTGYNNTRTRPGFEKKNSNPLKTRLSLNQTCPIWSGKGTRNNSLRCHSYEQG